MADTKPTDLTALNEAPNDSDLFTLVDVSDTTDDASGTSKKMTAANLKSGLQAEPSEGAFADGDKTKLDGIEASADVTDTANVTAAGALMDSEVTNLAQVKAFDSSDYATAAQGTTADSALQPGDNATQLDGTADRVLYINSSGDVTELALGANGTYLQSQGTTSAPTWSTPSGSGDVSKVGTPVNNELGVWTGDGTLEGEANLTYDGSHLTVGNFEFNADQTVGAGQDDYVLTYDNASGTIGLEAASGSGTGITWNTASTSTGASVNNGYITTSGVTEVVITLPASASIGDIVRIAGRDSAGWRLAQNASQVINFGASATTTGTGGYLQAVDENDAVEVLCTNTNNTWTVISSQGNITVV